jgi:methylmalonyl-CoA mutase C-terminal domain/subunit
MNKYKMDGVLLTGGGIIPQKDMDELKSYGVGELFGPGTAVNVTIDYINQWFQDNREDNNE